jgi:hypothetical protein
VIILVHCDLEAGPVGVWAEIGGRLVAHYEPGQGWFEERGHLLVPSYPARFQWGWERTAHHVARKSPYLERYYSVEVPDDDDLPALLIREQCRFAYKP